MEYKDKKAYNKAYYEAHKEDKKAYYEAHKEDKKAYKKDYYEANKDELLAKQKDYNKAHKEDIKLYREAHKEERNNYNKQYQKADVNSDGKTKDSIRTDSRRYLHKTLGFQKIDNYENHHCFGYENKKEFIYIPRWLHKSVIHPFLRKNKIDADTDHFEQIKHLLDSCNEPIFIIKDGKVTEYQSFI